MSEEGITVVVTDMPPPLLELFEDMFRHAMRAAKAEDDKQYEGWYCIQMEPVRCPGCGERMCYVEPPHLHLIIVWEDKDDENMLEVCKELKAGDRDPIIIQYHPMYGHCISWEDCIDMMDMMGDDDDD